MNYWVKISFLKKSVKLETNLRCLDLSEATCINMYGRISKITKYDS